MLAVNKPAGLVCHPTRDGEMSSLVGRLRLHLRSSEGRLVNRLDRETSGVVLIAKDAEAARDLGRLIAEGSAIQKRYWAIVHGHVRDASFRIDAPLGRDEHSEVAIKDCVRAGGAPASTEVRVLKTFERGGQPFSWVEAAPATGRKHQIRIHLAHAGHPIVGDKIYGADEMIYLRFVTRTMTEADHRALITEHHRLHARSLVFAWNRHEFAFEAPVDDGWPPWIA